MRNNSHIVQFIHLKCLIQWFLVYSFSVVQHLPYSNVKTFHPSRKNPLNPFIHNGEVEGIAMHFGSQVNWQRGKGGHWMDEGMSAFSVDHTGLLCFYLKADILKTVFPGKFSLWKIHCVIPLKPNGSVRAYKKAKL